MNKLLSLMDEHNLTIEDIEKDLVKDTSKGFEGFYEKGTIKAWRLGNRNCPDLAIAYIKQVRGLK
jgi:hypothetical protein